MGKERRKNTRVLFQTIADVNFAGKSYSKCETEDLSIKGISVIGPSGQSVGERCEISLILSGSNSKLVLKMRGGVVRVDPGGLALHFTEIDADSFYHLKNIIYYNSKDPDLIDLELIDG
ncbi:MAG: PilZ domain-containing protein [Deltaproteobacteria bacterium]|nr:MAG: PilZ domain-containing protein [Deltaproteobacteria bacterium]